MSEDLSVLKEYSWARPTTPENEAMTTDLPDVIEIVAIEPLTPRVLLVVFLRGQYYSPIMLVAGRRLAKLFQPFYASNILVENVREFGNNVLQLVRP